MAQCCVGDDLLPTSRSGVDDDVSVVDDGNWIRDCGAVNPSAPTASNRLTRNASCCMVIINVYPVMLWCSTTTSSVGFGWVTGLKRRWALTQKILK